LLRDENNLITFDDFNFLFDNSIKADLFKQFFSKNSRASLLLQLLPETSVHPVLPTALIVRARFPKPENCNARSLLTRRHAPRLSPANPPILISAAAARLLRLSCASYPRIRLVKTNLHQKSRRQKTTHAPVKLPACFCTLIHAPRPVRDPSRAPTRP
jgi:hypothetical protein